MKIVTLVENTVYKKNLLAEHGLSFFIETDNRRILFDTGQSDAFIHNAGVLGIDLTTIDALVLSHGHNDHTGGLYHFLALNSKAKVYCKPELFYKKYNKFGEFIGTEYVEQQLRNRLVYVTQNTQLFKGLWIIPQTTIYDAKDTSVGYLKIDAGNGPEQDTFPDELFLAITRNQMLSIVSSCSHLGITNIVQTARSTFNLPLNFILGGLHIKDCAPEHYAMIFDYLNQAAPKQIGVCHCTGIDKYQELVAQCNAKVFYNATGNQINC